jgi:transcriptional regulator with XRE-family HTH domain
MRRYTRDPKPPVNNAGVHWSVKWLWAEAKHKRITQLDLADKAGVSERIMRDWRIGVRAPKIVDVEAAVNCLGYELVLRKKADQ